MDNKALAALIKTELSKVTSAINKLVLKVNSLGAPWKDDQASIGPQDTASKENNSTGGKSTIAPHVDPSPSNSQQAKQPWYKTMSGWKALLEVIAIPCAIGYAVVTYFQWRDIRHNFEADQRAWIRVQWMISDDPASRVKMRVTNTGKTPAFATHTDAVFEIVNRNAVPSLSLSQNHTRNDSPPLFPGDDDGFEVYRPIELTTAERQDLIDGRSYLAIFGLVIYGDQFGGHWTRFCNWKGYTAGDFESRPCVLWNAVGDFPRDDPGVTMRKRQ